VVANAAMADEIADEFEAELETGSEPVSPDAISNINDAGQETDSDPISDEEAGERAEPELKDE